MKKPSFLWLMFAVSLVLARSVPIAHAAKSPAMESCSGDWKKMKGAGTIPSGQTWPKFWSQCAKDYAAAHPDQGVNDQNAAVPAPAPTKKASSAKTSTVGESTTGSGAEKKACDAKWAENKSSTGAHGWHDYFQFMSKCM